jgi:hypothetical protein
MDEDQKGVKDTVVEPEVESPTTQETPTVEGDKPEEVNLTEETETVEEPKTEESGKTANTRIRELNAKLKEEKTKSQSLAEKIAELTNSVEEPQAPFQPQVEPGAEVTPDQYKADVVRTAQAIAQLEIQRERALNRIHTESQEAIKKYPKLDPNSESFDKELSESVTEATLAYVRATPTASVTKFVDSLMRPYEKSLLHAEGQAEEKMAKQVSQAALRPTQVKAEEKPFDSLSISEMEKKLGGIQQS